MKRETKIPIYVKQPLNALTAIEKAVGPEYLRKLNKESVKLHAEDNIVYKYISYVSNELLQSIMTTRKSALAHSKNYASVYDLLVGLPLLIGWRKTKKVGLIDRDFFEQLISHKPLKTVPAAQLLIMRYKTMYVAIDNSKVDDDLIYDGFFFGCTLEDSQSVPSMSFLFHLSKAFRNSEGVKTKWINLNIPLDPNLTYGEYLGSMEADPVFLNQNDHRNSEFQQASEEQRFSKIAWQLLPFLMCFSAVNLEKKSFGSYYGTPNKTSKGFTAKVAHKTDELVSPVEVDKIGYRIGAAIRLNREERRKIINTIGLKGHKKIPHLRGIHPHTYTIGPNHENYDWERGAGGPQQIVKIIGPTFVNCDSAEDIVPAIHKLV